MNISSEYPILGRIRQSGIRVATVGEQLHVSPASKITRELAEWIRAHKQTILRMLKRSIDLAPCSQCGGSQLAVLTFDGYQNFECIQCDICTGCRMNSSPRWQIAAN